MNKLILLFKSILLIFVVFSLAAGFILILENISEEKIIERKMQNESLIPSKLEFWEKEAQEKNIWKQCDYLRGECDIKTSHNQILLLNCEKQNCWLAR